eukprot:scaffold14328_cov57-Attheya_sp.AAC.2
MEFVAIVAVIGDMVPTILHTRERKDVHNPIWVIPDSSVSGKVTHQVRTGHTSIAPVDVHVGIPNTNVIQQFPIMEDVHSGTVTQQDPGR